MKMLRLVVKVIETKGLIYSIGSVAICCPLAVVPFNCDFLDSTSEVCHMSSQNKFSYSCLKSISTIKGLSV